MNLPTPLPQAAPLPDPQIGARGLADALINQIECGLLACDAQGRLLFANRAALRELAQAQVLKLEEGLVRCVQTASLEFQAALRDATELQRARLLQLGQDSLRTMVTVTPVWHAHPHQRTALVMIGRRMPGSPLAVQMLALRHGLTPTETRVLTALLSDMPPRAIAAAHGVGLSTVRTQIQAVRNKLGARSIDALLLQVAELPPITTLH